MNREEQMKFANITLKMVGEPSHFVTICPMTPYMTTIEFNSILDESMKMFHADVFGHHWKENLKVKPIFVLFPEQNSNKTKKNSHELLHYHGVVSIDKRWLAKKYEKKFHRFFKQKMRHFRKTKLPMNNLQNPVIEFNSFDKTLTDECYAYCTKHYGYPEGFSFKDVYVSGLSRNINQVNETELQ